MNHELPTRYFDRELSWLEFNQRVLNQALDPQVPLMERLKFLAITSSNLDEFFRVRMGTLTVLVDRGATRPAPSGLSPREQLEQVRARITRMVSDQYECFSQRLLPAMTENGVHCLNPLQLSTTQKLVVHRVMNQEILSILTPMAVSSEVEFPLLPNQMLSLCVRLQDGPDIDNPELIGPRFAVIPFGRTLPRFLSVPAEKGLAYILLEDAISTSVDQFFPGEEIVEVVPFRITRNAEIEVQELTPHGLAWNMADVLRARTSAACLRLEVAASASDITIKFLQERLELNPDEVERIPGPLDLGAFFDLATRRGLENLRDEPWPPVDAAEVPAEELMFDVLQQRDVILLHPYESFEPVVRLVEEAADDPDVVAIKQTLYRISRDSAIVKALRRAVENGKHVTVLLELKARFDEERNLKQARELEAAGAQVIHGVKGLKTHAKLAIVVRREPHGIQRYIHFGTGNYNETTARLYSDVSLMTAHEDFGMDAISFFNAISGYSQPPFTYQKLEAAPLRLRETLKDLIASEIRRKRDGDDARIQLKLNALTDPELIDALYEASQAGVEIELNIRGICCLRPGVPELSERIRVVSIVDRFLEHSRILYFHQGGDPKVYISSADWMGRNLDHRKELLVPVEDDAAKQRLIHCLETYFSDNVKAMELAGDGTYSAVTADSKTPRLRAQEMLYRQVREAIRKTERRRRTRFEPHRSEE